MVSDFCFINIWKDRQKHFRSTSVKEFNSYDDRNFYFKVPAFQKVTIHPDLAHKVSFIQVGDEVNNPHLKEICQDGYVLKVTNRFFFSRVIWQSCLLFCWNVPAQARFKGPLLHRRAKPAHPPHGQGECSICRDDSQRFCRQQNLERINVQSLFEKCLCSEFTLLCVIWTLLSGRLGCSWATEKRPRRVGTFTK